MRPLERVPAVRRIQTDRRGLFALEITGDFMAADAENLRGLLEGEYALQDRVDLLIRIADLDQVDLDGLSPETATFLKDQAGEHLGRCALVGDASALAAVLPAGGEAEIRVFEAGREADAWAWIGAREIIDDV